jgi:glyoxylase-like metal-dependent hydrolase (beta-lactamase superfamily II)
VYPALRIISIGALEAHALWGERSPRRTAHATTTLISLANQHLIVNPSLPAPALADRLSERTPVTAEEITHVFLTSFAPDHRRGLVMFDEDRTVWLIHEPEREAASASLRDALDAALEQDDKELITHYQREIALLERCRNAPDSILSSVDLFPLPGVTPGTCGLVLALPTETVLVCGDAVATAEHAAQAQVLPHCADLRRAQESLAEALEIADILVPGRDNIMLNRARPR